MQVRDAMSRVVLQVGPDHTLRQSAQLMAARRVGSAIVIDPDGAGVGIITERDVLYAIGNGLDPDVERAANHITWDVVYAGPSWTIARKDQRVHLEADLLGQLAPRRCFRCLIAPDTVPPLTRSSRRPTGSMRHGPSWTTRPSTPCPTPLAKVPIDLVLKCRAASAAYLCGADHIPSEQNPRCPECVASSSPRLFLWSGGFLWMVEAIARRRWLWRWPSSRGTVTWT